MKKEKMKSRIEIFICNHKRENTEDCFHKGGKDLTDVVKKWAKGNYPNDVKVYRSGCLGKCEDGIAICTYPQKDFLLDVKKEDVKEVKDYIKNLIS